MPGRKPPSPQVRLFQNEQLERFTRISLVGFAATWCILLPLIAWIGWGTATPPVAIGLCAGGVISWFLFEYAMHRYLFHWKPRSAMFARFVFVMHGNHHIDPNDRLRSLMPPSASIPIASFVWAAYFLLFGPAGTWAFLGFMFGYVGYDVTHYACHQWPMKGPVSSVLKRHHMRHHHVDEDRNFAITAPVLDRLFGSLITSVKPQG